MKQETLDRAIELKRRIEDLRSHLKQVRDYIDNTEESDSVMTIHSRQFSSLPLFRAYNPIVIPELLSNYHKNVFDSIESLEKELEAL